MISKIVTDLELDQAGTSRSPDGQRLIRPSDLSNAVAIGIGKVILVILFLCLLAAACVFIYQKRSGADAIAENNAEIKQADETFNAVAADLRRAREIEYEGAEATKRLKQQLDLLNSENH